MKIINIDAPKEVVKKIGGSDIPLPNSLKILLEDFEEDYYNDSEVLQDIIKPHTSRSPIWKFECGRYENIAVLWHTIPIHLCDTKPRSIDESQNCIVDVLGAYFPNRIAPPYIELYLTDIYTEAKAAIDRDYPQYYPSQKAPKEPQYFKRLLTIVLLHELAHAALDIFNLVDAPSSEEVFYDTDFGKWREESMANAVALRIIRDYGRPTLINYAKKFMELQPAEYALGVLMEDFDADDFNSVFEAKIKGVNPMLQQQWLDYAQGSPDWTGLKAWNAKINSTFLS